ncbi:MAG: hypothetical protein IKI29_05670, partial [Clostridia bacterium]|nr:hypothetical protein [Clostridia bacterium]
MSRFWIQLAGLRIEVNALCQTTERFFADYLIDACVADFSVLVEECDIDQEKKIVQSQYHRERKTPPRCSIEELEETVVHRKIAQHLPFYHAFVFHGSAVAVKNRCFIFAAVSGTGKTTHTDLWLKNIPGSFVVNGDKPILRMESDGVYVYGTPWMGKEGMGCNQKVPLHAVCFLSRGKENIIVPCSFSDIVPRFLGQIYRPHHRETILQT